MTWLAATVLAALQAGGERLAPARLRLEGPLEEVRLELGARGGTVLAGRLLAGEVRAPRVPLPARPLGDAPPEIEVEGAGRARFDGWLGTPPREAPELRRRARPPVGPVPPAPDPLAVAVLLATAVVVAAARRRAGLALACGGIGAVLVAALQLRHPPPEPGRVRALEGVGERWVLVEGAAEVLAVDPAGDLALETEPPRVPLRYRGSLEDGPWTARAPDARLWRRAALDPGRRRLDPHANLWGDLGRVWFRDAGGAWRDHGPWPVGVPLPPARGEEAPPGWLAAGLPQDRPVWVARIGEDGWAGPPGPGGPADEAWLRHVLHDDSGRGR